MPTRDTLGGIVHTYQRYDPARIPPPRPAEVDLVTPAMEHLLEFGDASELTEQQLAEAIVLDPEQIKGLGPSLDSIRRRLEEARRKILETFETDAVRKKSRQRFREAAERMQPPARFREGFAKAVREEQLRQLERLWYAQDDDQSRFAGQLAGLIETLGEVYQVDELAATWTFSGRQKLTVPEALEVKERLEQIEELLKQLEEARKNAKVALIDMEALGQYLEGGERDELDMLRRQVQEMVERLAAEQGIQKTKTGYELTPQALRIFQGKLLERIFSALDPSRTGRHQDAVAGDGSVETVPTRAYEFGDSVAHMDIPGSLVNALLRQAGEGNAPGRPLRLTPRDIEVHRTRNTPKCATTVVMDMSGSMRYGGLHVSVKRMALALQGMVPPHFTNIQHALALSRQYLAKQDTPNRQVILITDGLPTAHFEGSQLYLLYPPHRRTEEATMREAEACRREGITVNVFLLSGWAQSREDIQFAYRLAEAAHGRVFFTAGKELERFVVWDYRSRRRSIIG